MPLYKIKKPSKQVLLFEGEVRARLLEFAPHGGELQRALGLHLRCLEVVAIHQGRGAGQAAADDGAEHGWVTAP